MRGLPDFVILGAMKSGTTSLYDFITQHPSIAPAAKKELQYFSKNYRSKILDTETASLSKKRGGEGGVIFGHYRLGKLWYRSNFPTNISKYYFYKKMNQKLLSGEASPAYLFYPTVPGRMNEVLPDVKLIVILRNPVDRAYSHHHHALRINLTTLSFENAIKSEEKRLAEEKGQMIKDPNSVPASHSHHSYLARGVYADQLENWFRHYDRKKFLILTTEDFRKNSQQALDQVFDFLEVPPFQVENLADKNVGNYKERMNEDTRKFLIEYFKPHNERLSKLLQRSFDWDK